MQDKVLPDTHSEGISEPPYGTTINKITEMTAGVVDTNFSDAPQRYGFEAKFEVVEPKEAAGQTWDYQWLAPADDPQADGEGLARIMNGRSGLGKCCTKAGVDYRRQPASKLCQLMKGKLVGVRSELRRSKGTERNPQGFLNSRVADWFAKGEATLLVKEKPQADDLPRKDEAPAGAPPPPPPGTVGRSS